MLWEFLVSCTLTISSHHRFTRRRRRPTSSLAPNLHCTSPLLPVIAPKLRSKTPPSTKRRRSPPAMAPPPTFGKRSSNPSPLTRLTGRGLPVTLVHRLHLPAGPGSPQRRLFQAAADGDLHLFKSTCTRRAPHLDSRPSLSFRVRR